jgi:MoxR-like ATPase
MSYMKTFEPKETRLEDGGQGRLKGRDGRDGSIYVYTEPVVLAVKVAIATGRPLLLYGPPGSGKSSLAAFVARTMNWNYFEQVITSRTQAQDLQWSFDAVRRLRDAKASDASIPMGAYVEPRVLWWAFDSVSASQQGPQTSGNKTHPPGIVRGHHHPSAVLIDEIDKADPDVPNDLLVVLGSQRFRVPETGQLVEPTHPPLLFVTTNDERELPRAFLRRCVIHKLEEPSRQRLIEIAQNHFPEEQNKENLFAKLADKIISMRELDQHKGSRAPSNAEYLDAVRACIDFGVEPGTSPAWQGIESAVLVKGN